VAAGLTFVIFVHELGHFLVAKACGVKCEKFYVGFDFLEFKLGPIKIPRALIKFQWGETEYGLGSLAAGRLRENARPGRRPPQRREGSRADQGPPGRDRRRGTCRSGRRSKVKSVMLDPRSYPAKPVPARMAIISAGVIMNLIFAVILAAVAYRMGVPHVPAAVGQVGPGSPAWSAGMEPGSKILQLGRSGSPYEHLRYVDLLTAVVLNGYDRDLPILVRRPDGQEVWYEIRPSDRLKKAERRDERRPQIGIGASRSRDVRVGPAALSHLGPQATPELQDKDVVVQAAGQPVESGADLDAIMAQNPDGSLTITVKRPDASGKQPGSTETPEDA
jgi:regulator of sigma E protease